MAPVSKLLINHMPRIISETENYHLKKRPWDEIIIKGVLGGFYSAIEKLKQEKEGVKC